MADLLCRDRNLRPGLDFGELPPGDYSLSVAFPGEDAVDFGFSIDPDAPHKEVLIDASPAYYCRCCGWNFEPR